MHLCNTWFNKNGLKFRGKIACYSTELITQKSFSLSFFKEPVDFANTRLASTWLGLEFNLFADVCFDNTMKFYGVASVFVPGSHYSDIEGIALNRDQKTYLDSLKNNTPAVQVPLLGTNAAFALNVGFEYRF